VRSQRSTPREVLRSQGLPASSKISATANRVGFSQATQGNLNVTTGDSDCLKISSNRFVLAVVVPTLFNPFYFSSGNRTHRQSPQRYRAFLSSETTKKPFGNRVITQKESPGRSDLRQTGQASFLRRPRRRILNSQWCSVSNDFLPKV
jgi:hypothetical protein